MSCDVYVSDDLLAPIRSGAVELLELDYAGRQIDHQWSGRLGTSAYGATLATPAPTTPVTVWVNDTSRRYAPASLGYLDISLTTRLDVALYPVPVPASGGGGGGPGLGTQSATRPQTPDEVAQLIAQQMRWGVWSEAEANGVRALVDAVIRGTAVADPDGVLGERVAQWREQLAALGIAVVADKTHRGSGSSGSSGSSGARRAGGEDRGEASGGMVIGAGT
jgi:hypothetical protein